MSNNSETPLFQTILLANHLQSTSFELALRVFSQFFSKLTPKHHRRVKLYILDAPAEWQLLAQKKSAAWSNQFSIVSFDTAANLFSSPIFFEHNNLIFHPEHRQSEPTRVVLLSLRCPILTYQSWEKAHAFDAAATVLLSEELEEQSMSEFSHLLAMLYHDPGAFSMLKNKANRLRKNEMMRFQNS